MGNDGAIAGIKVVATVEGRSDDRLAPAGPGFVSATDVVLTTWDSKTKVPTITNELRADDPRPGPLVAEGGRVGWGAALIGGPVTGGPVTGARRHDQRRTGAGRSARARRGGSPSFSSQVGGRLSGRLPGAALCGTRGDASQGGPGARAIRSACCGGLLRTLGLTSVAFSQDEAITAAYWDGGTAVVGRPSSFVFWSLDGARTLMVEDGTAARSLVPIGHGRWVAGMASGQLVTFTEDGAEANVAAHSGPATALAYDRGSGSLASGGEDGTVLVSRRSGGRSEFDAGGSVEALTWASDGVLVAKIDGVDGRLLLMRPE